MHDDTPSAPEGAPEAGQPEQAAATEPVAAAQAPPVAPAADPPNPAPIPPSSGGLPPATAGAIAVPWAVPTAPPAGAPYGQAPPTPPAGQHPWPAEGLYPTAPAAATWPGAVPTAPQTPPAHTWPGAAPAAPMAHTWPGMPPGATPPPGYWGGPAMAGATPPGGTPHAAQPSTRNRHGVLIVGLCAALAALLIGVAVGHGVWKQTSAQSPASNSPSGGGFTVPGNGNGNGSSGNFPGFNFGSGGTSGGSGSSGASAADQATASKVDPGLVDINTSLNYQDEEAAGTGMVLTSNGLILTNNHVIDGATSIHATDLGNGHTYNATVVGYTRSHDIAVIQLQHASGLKTVTTGDSSSVTVGQSIIGIGNAGGAGGTPSVAGGKVTALGQKITASDQGGSNPENLSNMIEVNADIQPGDSGGPLVTTDGTVVGMDTAANSGVSYSSSSNQGYAIPINTALNLAHQIESGQTGSGIHLGKTAFIGVEVTTPASDTNSPGGTTCNSGSSGSGSGSGSNGYNPFNFGFGSGASSGPGASSGGTGSGSGSGSGSGTGSTSSGAQIVCTVSGAPADKAGLQSGDIIVAVNGTQIVNPTALTNALNSHHPGDTVSITWTDSSGQRHTAQVTLASGPPQ